MHHSTFLWITDKTYLHVVLVFNLLWLLSANMINLYKTHVDNEMRSYQRLIGTYTLYLVLVCYIILFLNNIQSYFITREYLFESMTLFGFLIGIWKVVFSEMRKYFATNGPSKTAIIVGGGKAGLELYNCYKNNLFKGYTFLGLFDDEPSRVPDAGLYLGDTSLCIEYAMENKVDEIICALPFSEHKTIERLIKDSDKNLIRFKLVPEHYGYFQGSLFAQSINNIHALAIRVEPLENIMSRVIKRFFDILFSSFVIVFILSWLYPIIYFLIKLESPGPVFFVQERSGRDNNPFKCYKFRSMRVNDEGNTKQATKGDARITKVGAFLRRTSLDEFPQFFNVLLGHMSVVGPRPHMLSHTLQYSQLIDQFMVRHFIKPGITGWAQINGLRGETKTVNDMLARVEADVWYMENWSFLLDLRIIVMTFFKSIYGDKNAF